MVAFNAETADVAVDVPVAETYELPLGGSGAPARGPYGSDNRYE
jgi:hypothetical protein